METSQERYRKIKEFGLSQGLPDLPVSLRPKLEECYQKYLKFAGILVENFDELEIEQEREKYKYLYLGISQGFPIFDEQNCLHYMNLISGISKKYCAIYMYLDYVETVASGLLEQPPATWKDLIEHQLSFTQKVIEEEKERQQKNTQKILETKNSQTQQSSKTHTVIFLQTGSGKSIAMFPYIAKENQIKIRHKKSYE